MSAVNPEHSRPSRWKGSVAIPAMIFGIMTLFSGGRRMTSGDVLK